MVKIEKKKIFQKNYVEKFIQQVYSILLCVDKSFSHETFLSNSNYEKKCVRGNIYLLFFQSIENKTNNSIT